MIFASMFHSLFFSNFALLWIFLEYLISVASILFFWFSVIVYICDARYYTLIKYLYFNLFGNFFLWNALLMLLTNFPSATISLLSLSTLLSCITTDNKYMNFYTCNNISLSIYLNSMLLHLCDYHGFYLFLADLQNYFFQWVIFTFLFTVFPSLVL